MTDVKSVYYIKNRICILIYSAYDRGFMALSASNESIVYWMNTNLYLNITNYCSNDCYFCLRKFKKGVGGFNLQLKHEPSSKEIIHALQGVINRKNWREIVFCGFGEPLAKFGCLLKVAKWIKKYYKKPFTLRVDTNGHGYLLNETSNVVEELKNAGVMKISVSLNAENKEVYNQICRPKFKNAFEYVLDFIDKAKNTFEVEVTVVRLPDINIQRVKEIAKKMAVPLRVREYIPCVW